MLYVGMPLSSSVTCTVPVGYGTRAMLYPSPFASRAASVSSPNLSSPTALTAIELNPNCRVWYAKLAGAPPSFLPSGRTSHSASPSPTIMSVFIIYTVLR